MAAVARHRRSVPMVSAVGHESILLSPISSPICAPTPTAAAQWSCRAGRIWRDQVQILSDQLTNLLPGWNRRLALGGLIKRLPIRRELREAAVENDELSIDLMRRFLRTGCAAQTRIVPGRRPSERSVRWRF
jgi:exonuclease VII large subunit